MPKETSSVTIYHNPNCSTSKKVLGWLKEKGHEPKVVEYLKQHGADTVVGQLNWDEKGDLTKSTYAWFIFSNGKFAQAAN